MESFHDSHSSMLMENMKKALSHCDIHFVNVIIIMAAREP